MSKSRNRKPENKSEKLSEITNRKRRVLLLTATLIVLLLTGGALAQWNGVFSSVQQGELKSQPGKTELELTSPSANQSAKDYVYLNGKLLSTEEPGCVALSPTNQYFPESTFTATGQPNVPNTGSFTISATCNWSIGTPPSFITGITPSSGGSGTQTVTFTVQNNATTSIRSGTITVNNTGGAPPQVFTVYQGIAYADVPRNYTNYTAIGKLSARGMVPPMGCTPGGNFCPLQNVTREEMSLMLIRSLHEPTYTPPNPPSQRFPDVPSSNIYYAYIDELAVRQITLGCGGGNYCPNLFVARKEMAAFIVRALQGPGYVPLPPAMQRFTDVPVGHQFYGYIEEMFQRGITLGCNANPPQYCPDLFVTREQMALFLVRAFGL